MTHRDAIPSPVERARDALGITPRSAHWDALIELYEAGRHDAWVGYSPEALDRLARQIIGTIIVLDVEHDDAKTLEAVKGLLSTGVVPFLPTQIEEKMVPELGVTLLGVWVPYHMLEELQSRDGLEGFEPGVNLPAAVERALIAAGVAHRSTRGSLFPNRTELDKFIEGINLDVPEAVRRGDH